jgi:hypothetical protein
MTRARIDIEEIRSAARRSMDSARPRRFVKLEWDGGNYVSERLRDPGECAAKSYRAVSSQARRANVPPGVVVTTCCALGDERTNGACASGGSIVQRIQHHVERFKIRHAEEWKRLASKAPDERGVRVLWFEEVADMARYKKVAGRSSLAEFGGMFEDHGNYGNYGDHDFKTHGAMMKYLTESGWLGKQVEQRRAAEREKRQRAKDKRAARAAQSLVVAAQDVQRQAAAGLASMDFKDGEAIRTWLSMIAPKGYGAEFVDGTGEGADSE